MRGQWIGSYGGTNSGLAVLDLDDDGHSLSGIGYVFDDDPQLVGTAARMSIPADADRWEGELNIYPFEASSGVVLSAETLAATHPDIVHDTRAAVSLRQDGDVMNFSFETAVSKGNGILQRGHANARSTLPVVEEIQDWARFRQYVANLERDRFLFRGQPDQRRLRTSFHRTRRKNLVKYIEQDIPAHYVRMCAQLPQRLDISNPLELGALYGLAQHHGYPTPLLDWTYSPYIAAYFAYRNVDWKTAGADAKVRIFVLDARSWNQDTIPYDRIHHVRPHFSIIRLLPIGNTRMIPQMAHSTLTNVDDIEYFVSSFEEDDKVYLKAIDLPVAEKPSIMQELEFMGISAGSLFPGLDGTFEDLKLHYFS